MSNTTTNLNETQLIIFVLFIGAIAHLVAYQVWATRGDRGIENYDTRIRPFMWTVWAWPFHYGVFACLLIDYLWGNKAKERKYYEDLGRYYASGMGGGYSATGLAAPQIGEEAERGDTGSEEHCYYHQASRSFVYGGYWGYAQQYHGL
nr:MAG TPA: hypothetical protein [Caudoviricetes sp.]